jgi:NAD(P)-dependent dehydrogenase (short-subunit alcohol dehydrogenase family)
MDQTQPTQPSDFAGKVVVVTGAAQGIGRGIAEAFARAGATVILADYVAATTQQAAREISTATGVAAHALGVDVRDADSVSSLVDRVLARLGRIDVLVNNAAVYPNTPVLEMTDAEWDAVFDTNVKGVFLVSRAVAQSMVDRGEGGRIINISSGAGVSGRVGASHYCSSKAAVNMFTRVLAMELGPHRITVNAVAPGLIEVERTGELAPEYVDKIVRNLPAGRIGKPDDIARACLFLASPASSFITGSILSVDGGSTAGRTELPLSRKA